MATLRNLLLFGGWVPSLLGGGVTVWWLTSDKTIREVLQKRGVTFLESREDFQNIYYEFEGNELFKDIPDARKNEWRGISEWCKEKLELPLTEENIKGVLPKVRKYCLKEKKISSGISKFKNFSNIFNLLEKDGISSKTMPVIAHLGDDSTKDSYYFLGEGDSLEEALWTNRSTRRESVFSKSLYIDEKHKILGHSGSDALGRWIARGRGYDGTDDYHLSPYRNKEKIPDLPNAFWNRNRDSGVNLLQERCKKFLNQKYNDEKSLEDARKHFTNWCIENIELAPDGAGIVRQEGKEF